MGAILLAVLLTAVFTACDDDDNGDNNPATLNGSWSTPSGDVSFFVSQESKIDTLRVTLTFTGDCSGSIITTMYGVNISDNMFTGNLGSSWEGSTGSIKGTFSQDKKTCNGTYNYDNSTCNPISESWTATPSD